MNHNELNTISYVGDFTSFTKEVDKKLEESR